MGDVQVIFGVLIHYFMQRPSYFLKCTPSSSTFTESFIFFDSSLLQVFGCLLGLGCFDSPEGPLAHKQVSFPMIFDGKGSY
jgi:hypothetical protein